MTSYDLTYHRYSERSILVNWPQQISTEILQDVLRFKSVVENSNIKQILQVNNAYNSILVFYNFTIENIYDEILALKRLYAEKFSVKIRAKKLWHIPVCYDASFGIDLEAMSLELGLNNDQLIEQHSGKIYTVFFLGFLPGFMYLGGLSEQLYYPRKETPRIKVSKGAVAIGGEQTGVYPMESPGGWNIIGNTPIDFFDPKASLPCFVKAGDQIKFEAVTIDRYHHIQEEIDNAQYNLKVEEING